MTKRWTQSRTIWFNVATGLVGAGSEFAAVAALIDAEWATYLRIGLAVLVATGNVILRVLTDKAVTR